MTEALWRAAKGAAPLLILLGPRAGERKLRLLAAAFCRRVWHLTTPAERAAVRAAELYADGNLRPGPFRHRTRLCSGSALVAGALWGAGPRSRPGEHAAQVRRTATACALRAAEPGAAGHPRRPWKTRVERAVQAALVRDVFGDLFLTAADRGERAAWAGGLVLRFAQAVYAERAFDRLPILADALEDAGCTDTTLLDHCRSGGEHARGCWAVDLILGKS